MEYRRASPGDIDTLVELRLAMRAEREELTCPMGAGEFVELTRTYFTERLPSGDFAVWLAVEEGDIVGTAALCLHHVPPTYGNPTGKVAYLVNLYVSPDYRGQGIATRLLELLVEEAGRLGCGRAALNASKAGRPVCEKVGFTDAPGEMEMFLD